MATVAALRKDGCTPLGVCAYLAGLGGRAPAAVETIDDLARSFELEGLSAAPSTFDREQLDARDAAVAFASKLGAAQLAVAVRARLSVNGSPAALDELAGEACAAFAEDKLNASGVVRALAEALTPDRAGMVEAAAAHGTIARRLVADRAALHNVVDATSCFTNFLLKPVAFDPGFQVTYGALLKVEKHPFPLDKLVLMDYRDEYIGDDAAMRSRNERFPTFMYVMPISDTEIFFEETVLVSRPGADSADLEARLRKRLSVSYGIEHFEVLESERAAIPMGGEDPVVPQRVVGCGATASCVHPASGYMVARALEVAPRVGAALAAHPRLAEGCRPRTPGWPEAAAPRW